MRTSTLNRAGNGVEKHEINATVAGQLYHFILSQTAKETKISVESLLTEKGRRSVTEARMMLVHLVYKHTTYSHFQIGTFLGLSKSQIHNQVTKMNEFLGSPKFYKDVVSTYMAIADAVEAYKKSLSHSKTESPQPITAALVDLPNTTIPTEATNLSDAQAPLDPSLDSHYTGNEHPENDLLDSPSLEDSPLDQPVINRSTENGFSRLFNDKIEEATVVADTTPAPEAPAPPQIDPTTDTGSAANEAPPLIDPQFAGPDVGEMQFDAPPSAGSEEQGYDIPPEAASKIADFSTKTMLDMAKVAIPGISYRLVEIDEIQVKRIVEDAPETFRNKAVAGAKRINTDNEATLKREVAQILPYMEGPLRQIVEVEKLKVTPATALIFFGLWLGVVLWLNIRKMSQQRDMHMSELKALMATYNKG